MTAISKDVYFDVLDDIVNKYNNTVHRTIKTKAIDVMGDVLMLNIMKILIEKILNLKLVAMLEFQNIKAFLLKDILQIGQKKFLLLNKIKNTVLWTYAISDLNGEDITGSFYEKELQKTTLPKKNLE